MPYWAKTYGGGTARGVAVNRNGDIIVVGQTEDKNAFIAQLDKEGNVKWFKTYGGSNSESFNDVKITPNGDIIVAGYTSSFGSGRSNAWVLRLDENGNVKWQKSYGGSDVDVARAVAIADNGDIIVAGYTRSLGFSSLVIRMLRLDSNGNVKWQKSYGGGNANAVAIAPNGDIIVVGQTEDKNAFIAQLDKEGNVKWFKTYGGSNSESFNDVKITPNGDIIVAGYTSSFGSGRSNAWVLRLDENGNVKWQKSYGGSDVDEANAVAIADNGDIIIAGYTWSFRGAWVLRLDEKGNVKWQKSYGGGNANAVAIAPNGDIIVAGYHGYDVWVLCLPPDGDFPNWYLCKDSEFIIMDTHTVVKNTKCKVKKVSGLFSKFKTTNTVAVVRTERPEIKALYKLSETEVPAQHKTELVETLDLGERVTIMEASQISEDPGLAGETKTLEGLPQSLLSRYEPLEFLGEGGFAKVFKAKRKSDGEIVALKIPRIDEKTSSLFLKEIAAWYHLNHPTIVKLYKADILPIPYLEMEYVEGAKIDDKIVRELDKYPKPIEENTALKLIKGIAEGLKHAHSKGIWHLDLKPLNVLLKSNLTPKITDWGLAKISARSSLSTHSGYSPLYAAPEQLDEKIYGVPDHRTDIYGLGVIFYELLTGRLPYEGYSPGAVVGKILAKDVKPTPPSKINPALAKYDCIFEKLLAKRKEDRYQSVEEFLQALDALEALYKEREELKKSLEETKRTLKRSRSKEEIQKLIKEAVEKTAKIALLSARLNDKAELLNALEDLKFYTRENLDELLSAISQVEVMIKEGIPISDEFVEGLKVLLHRIEREV